MQDARWQAELLETKNELQLIKDRMSLETPTVHKDLSLISVVPKWSGTDSTITLDEFFTSIESSARIGNWQENDQLEIEVLRLTGAAKLFYQGCTELHEAGVSWQIFKDAFRSRFKDVRKDQYHFTRLQTARQAKNESPQVCRSVSGVGPEDYGKGGRPSDSARSSRECRAYAPRKFCVGSCRGSRSSNPIQQPPDD
jgi:hypothetical protein